jgi:uncharacterized protein YjiS (DUF1127 family)
MHGRRLEVGESMTNGESIVMQSNPYEFDFQTYGRWRPSLFQSLREFLNGARQARQTRREIQSLHDLSDHMLEDIGLTRADLWDDPKLTKAAESRLHKQR